MINLSSMFAKSPFKPLRDHMDKVVESVAPLKDFFDALHQGNYSKADRLLNSSPDAVHQKNL